ncbi:MAG: restriction system protein [Candidatus Sumerlaeota bacterium]|nr:restriction system protein [Candidatus Sumerlaeota bacterium]
MAVPDFQSIMLPMLQFAADGNTHSMVDAREALAKEMGLSEEDRSEMLPSGRQRRFDNRVAWAKIHLEKAGLLVSPKRGIFEITDRGRHYLANAPERITIRALKQFEEFRAFREGNSEQTASENSVPAPPSDNTTTDQTPDELLQEAYDSLRADVAEELLGLVRGCSPAFFERLVVDLLLKMGYGRNRKEAGRAIGRSGDEGIDGIISEDRLGLEALYIQAKRWEGTVGRPEIQKFVGALHGQRARKGVFITTSAFSAEARAYAANIETKVVLIDGRELAEFMLDYNLGVTVKEVYEVKRVDSDYFAEE